MKTWPAGSYVVPLVTFLPDSPGTLGHSLLPQELAAEAALEVTRWPVVIPGQPEIDHGLLLGF
jgi:hypothetical protein